MLFGLRAKYERLMIFCDIGIEVYQRLTHFYKGTRTALMGKDQMHCSTNASCLLSALYFPVILSAMFSEFQLFSQESTTTCEN